MTDEEELKDSPVDPRMPFKVTMPVALEDPREVDGIDFVIESMVRYSNNDGGVVLSLGNVRCTVEPDKAMEIAFHITEAACQSMSDAFIANFGIDRLGLDQERVAILLGELRQYRNSFPIRRGWWAK